MRYALLSVSDKTGAVELARALHARGYSLLSTGGTAGALEAAGLPVVAVSTHTGAPEIFGGRVKTLHPRIHGGILARRGVDDAAAQAQGIPWIDVVVVNLYPFEQTVRAGASADEALEQIDIGGPAMIRAAAKNHGSVHVAVDPSDYPLLLADLDAPVTGVRRRLAARAFAHVAAYDAAVALWLEGSDPEPLPETLPLGLRRVRPLRYGENPHQAAALYDAGEGGRSLARAEPLQGKELSFNNLADLDAAVRAVFELPHAGPDDLPAVAIVKHLNPCGVGAHPDGLPAAFRLALSADPVSAYGGIVALNRPLDGAAAEAILDSGVFFEAIAAPGVTAEARERCARRPNLRVLALPEGWAAMKPEGTDARRIQGGWLLQTWDVPPETDWSFSGRSASESERRLLRFAWGVVRAVRSNAIVLAREAHGGLVTNGVGAGQMSRVDAVRLAVARATRPVPGSVLASDAFFPFADGVERALEAGVGAFVQPGGSLRDAEVRAAIERAGATMAWTGTRHFRH